MNTEIKVSIIVPVHNGEKHLRETMECITKQTLTDIEIIFVDDGSTDTTVRIIEEYQKEDARIILFKNSKSNAGAARNFAMDRAKGKYLLFWDADDLFDLQAVELMYQRIEQDHADIVICNADHYDTESQKYIPKTQYLNWSYMPDTVPFSKESFPKYILNFSAQVAWNKMFSAEFVKRNGIRFQEIPRINDHYFVSVSMILAEKITITDKVLVHYRVNQKENLTGSSSETPLCKYEVQCAIQTKLTELGILENSEIRQSFINKAIGTLIHGLNIQNDIEGFRILYNTLKTEGLERLELTGHEPEYFYNQMNYRNLLLIQELEYDAYLLNKGRDYRRIIEEKKMIIVGYKGKINKLEENLQTIKESKWHKLGKKVLPVYYKLLRK